MLAGQQLGRSQRGTRKLKCQAPQPFTATRTVLVTVLVRCSVCAWHLNQSELLNVVDTHIQWEGEEPCLRAVLTSFVRSNRTAP